MIVGDDFHPGALAFSPTGRTLATGSGGQFTGVIKLWDVKTGKLKRTLIRGTLTDKGIKGIGPVWNLAFSPDGNSIAAGVTFDGEESLGGEVVLIDTRTAKRKLRLNLPNHSIQSLAYSPGGKLIAVASDDGITRLCSAQTGKVLRATPKQNAEIKALTFTPDSKYFITASDKQTLKFWNVKTGKLSRTLWNVGGKYTVSDASQLRLWMAFSQDSQTLAISGENTPIRLVHIKY